MNLYKKIYILFKNAKESLVNRIKGYGYFPMWQIWNLKYTFTSFALPRLKLYLEKVRHRKKCYSIPTWVDDEFHLSTSQLDSVQLKIVLTDEKIEDLFYVWEQELEKIIFAFEYIYNPTQDRFSSLDYKTIDEKVSHGLNLFAKYYIHLWD